MSAARDETPALDAEILATPLTVAHAALLLLADDHADEVAGVLYRLAHATGDQA